MEDIKIINPDAFMGMKDVAKYDVVSWETAYDGPQIGYITHLYPNSRSRSVLETIAVRRLNFVLTGGDLKDVDDGLSDMSDDDSFFGVSLVPMDEPTIKLHPSQIKYPYDVKREGSYNIWRTRLENLPLHVTNENFILLHGNNAKDLWTISEKDLKIMDRVMDPNGLFQKKFLF